MACKRCEERGKTWEGSDPVCAFKSGTFSADNWRCATMSELRKLCGSDVVWSEDQNAALLPTGDGGHVVMTWYKSRGRVDGAYIMTCEGVEPLGMGEAEAVILFNSTERHGPL
jgi:hypothetical protein